MANWLLLTIFLPLVGAAAIFVLADAARVSARWIALGVSLATLLSALWLVAGYQHDPSGSGYAVTELSWLGTADSGIDVQFNVGLDGLSLWLFALSAVLSVTAVLVSWEAIVDRPAGFYALLLLLETGMLGVFAARDIILFYIFFEFTLIPLFFLIGVWGSEDRRRAAVKFFLYTFAGSVLTFLGLLAIVLWVYYQPGGKLTFCMVGLRREIAARPIDPTLQLWIFAALFAGFAIKVPLFPLHTWLPLAHVQAPTAGSVLLAGVLLKIGGYGFVRFSLPLLPDATAVAMPWVLWLATAGILYGALVALAQSDIKRLIAYSSVSHLGFCLLGFFALNRLGMQGGVLQMINHGLSTGGLFAVVGMLYERYHTREIRQLGGLAKRTPLLAVAMLLFTFSSIGLPGLNGFSGEFLLLTGMFQRGFGAASPAELTWQLKAISVLAVLGVVLGAWYMLWLVQRTFFGPLKEPASAGHGGGHGHAIHDLSLREILALAPLVVLMFWIGLQPKFFLDRMSGTLDPIADRAAAEFQTHYFPAIVNASSRSDASWPSETAQRDHGSSAGFLNSPGIYAWDRGLGFRRRPLQGADPGRESVVGGLTPEGVKDDDFIAADFPGINAWANEKSCWALLLHARRPVMHDRGGRLVFMPFAGEEISLPILALRSPLDQGRAVLQEAPARDD